MSCYDYIIYMNNNIQNKKINLFNTRGLLRSNFKQNNNFKWLKNSHPGISMIQEMHAIHTYHEKWTNKWKGRSYFSYREANSKGVATLIPIELTENSLSKRKQIATEDFC